MPLATRSLEGARRSEQDLVTYLTRLKEAASRRCPNGREILDDDVRKVLCPDKITPISGSKSIAPHTAWDCDRTSRSCSAPSRRRQLGDAPASHASVAAETVVHRVRALPFVHMATPIFLQGRARRGPTFREAVLMHSVARLHYATLIDNIQVSWVKMARGIAPHPRRGANDVGYVDGRKHLAGGRRRATAKRWTSTRCARWSNAGAPLVQRSTLYQTL